MRRRWVELTFQIYFIVFSRILKLCDQFIVCPSECHEIACQTGVLSCTDGGLVQIPQVVPLQITKIILSNQRFYSPYLEYFNLSKYGPPDYKIVKLTIQNCELVSIASNSFSHLSELNILDLSNNQLKIIAPDTFSSLNLKFLRLDGNRNIILNQYSFRGLSVTELSLIECSLKELDFAVINEISGSLKKLILTNNKLKTLEKSFMNLFEHLPNLQINDNPFNCTCSLKWLGSLLVWRKKRLESLPSVGLSNEAQCNSPLSVRGKRIVDLSPKEFNCDFPKLKLIDVYMTSNISARLTCSSENEKYSNTDVIWMTEKDNIFVHEVRSKDNAALLVSKGSPVDQFKCIIINDNGNVTVWISIHWPLNNSINMNTSSTSFNDLNRYIYFINNSLNVNSVFSVKRFTLLEMIGGVVGTFTFTMLLFLCIYRHLSLSLKNNHMKKWYISYAADMVSDSQTYDIPVNSSGQYYPGQLLTNPYTPTQYLSYNNLSSYSSPNKIAAL